MVLRRRAAGLKADSRRFWIGVALVGLVHTALIVGFVRSAPRYLGELGGGEAGISVELVDAADLVSLSTVRAVEPSTAALPGSAPPPEPKTAAVPPIEADTPSPQAQPPARKDSSPAPPAQNHPMPSLAVSPSLHFDLPEGAFTPGRRHPAVTRPPNVTQSRENVEFGHGVIRALYKTMPKAGETVARVTVRLFLSEHGNLTELQLVRSSGDPILDQNVMFAARQSSFPIPPAGATLADRTFLVTYIYR